MSNSDDSKSKLDLGLGTLLSAESEKQQVPENIAKPEASLSQKSEEKAISHYRQLLHEKRWSDLLLYCEKKLAQTNNQDSEASIWWVRANFELKAMPLAVLAAPLDMVTKNISSQNISTDFKSIMAETLALVGAELARSNSSELSLSFLERAKQIDATYAASFTQVLDSEIHKLENVGDLSTKNKVHTEQKLGELKEKRGITDKITVPLDKSDSNYRRSMIAASLLSLIAIFGILYAKGFNLSFLYDSSEGLPVMQLSKLEFQPVLRDPELVKVRNVSAFSGLYYDLTSQPNVAKVEPVVHKTTETQAAEDKKSPQPKLVEKKSKDVVDTSGPKESLEVKQALREGEKNSREKDNSEILFGKSAIMKGASSVSDSAGYNVERFSSPKLYTIIARTHIVAQPGFRTEVVGELMPGDKVMAEARVESWLEVRSNRGRTGYVLIQDAEISR